MILKITAAALGIIALLLTFRGKQIIERITKTDEVSDKQTMRLKLIALVIAIAAFGMVFRV